MAVNDHELGVMEFDTREKANNVDVLYLVSKIDDAIRQFSTCPSHHQNVAETGDVVVAQNLVIRLAKKFADFANDPKIWMPNASPYPKPVPRPPQDLKIVQNTFFQSLVYKFAHMRTQLLFAESADRIAGFETSEVTSVFNPWLAKTQSFIDEELETLTNTPEHEYAPELVGQPIATNPGIPR